MKNTLLLFAFAFNINAQVMWQIKKDMATKWYLQDHDEFNSLDTTLKYFKSGFPWSPHVMGLDLIYKSDNLVFKDDGTLTIVTKKEAFVSKLYDWDIDKNYLQKTNKVLGPNNEYTFNYTSGAITSVKKFKYGYFEMRFIANKEQGTWPAFWLYGGNPNEEIDFYEGKGEKDNQIHIDVHCPKGCDDYKGGFLNLKKNWGAWIKAKESLANGWNIISGEWQPNYVKFFLNGDPIGYYEGEFKTEQQLFINTSVAKDGGAFKPGPDNTTKWPNEFVIDYVRVWNLSDSLPNQLSNYKNFIETQKTITNHVLYNTLLKSKVNFVYNSKKLENEEGTITLLPIALNKYSLSISGSKLNEFNVELFNLKNEKTNGFNFKNTTYNALDLSDLPSGTYLIKITVLGKTVTHQIDVLNPIR